VFVLDFWLEVGEDYGPQLSEKRRKKRKRKGAQRVGLAAGHARWSWPFGRARACVFGWLTRPVRFLFFFLFVSFLFSYSSFSYKI
jgi:hypothetical protein